LCFSRACCPYPEQDTWTKNRRFPRNKFSRSRCWYCWFQETINLYLDMVYNVILLVTNFVNSATWFKKINVGHWDIMVVSQASFISEDKQARIICFGSTINVEVW